MLKIQTFTIGPIETNCYLAYDEHTKEAILIDPAIYDERIAEYIKSHGLHGKFIVNTHGHYDHISGNKLFGYPILIHEKDKGCLKNPLRNFSFTGNTFLQRSEAYRLLKGGDTIEINNASFKVIHTPGHTPGSITLEYNDVLFTGDTLFFESVGRTDIPYASTRDLKNSLKKLMHYSDNVKVYPGHGPSSTIGHEREYNPFIEQE